jgi:hypothetical protein
MSTDDSENRDRTHARNDAERRRQIRQWATYVRTHPDEEWGRQVNTLVDAQIQSARHHRNDGTRSRADTEDTGR